MRGGSLNDIYTALLGDFERYKDNFIRIGFYPISQGGCLGSSRGDDQLNLIRWPCRQSGNQRKAEASRRAGDQIGRHSPKVE